MLVLFRRGMLLYVQKYFNEKCFVYQVQLFKIILNMLVYFIMPNVILNFIKIVTP